MITSRQKLVAASLVLAGGFALAWPLRRDEPFPAGRVHSGTATRTATPAQLQEQMVGTVSPPASLVGPKQLTTVAGPSLVDAAADPFARVPMPGGADAPTNVFTTVSSVADETAALPNVESSPDERHIVHEGDSLARLASRYLGDEARALEIFDLNRDVLDNPHVLPLGVELRIPRDDMPVDEGQRAAAPN